MLMNGFNGNGNGTNGGFDPLLMAMLLSDEGDPFHYLHRDLYGDDEAHDERLD